MTKPFPLQIVLELMQDRADEATQELARLIASERDAKNKLVLLQNYRDEYASKFQQAAQNGLTRREWHNYQSFLSRLDDAIEAQTRTVAQQVQHTAQGQSNWQAQRKKLKAFDTLSERHFASENSRAWRQEQKTQDEFAAREREDAEPK